MRSAVGAIARTAAPADGPSARRPSAEIPGREGEDEASRASAHRRPPERPWVLHLGILGLVAALCLPSLGYDFVYDDHWTIVSNGFLRTPSAWIGLLTPAAARAHVPDAFRAVSVLADGITYLAFGLRPAWHHAVSVALHVIVTALGARWLRRLGAPLHVQIGTAGLFGVMAIHAEPIAVVSYREDLLAAALGLSACLSGERALGATKRYVVWCLAGTLCLALATSAKLSAAPLPFVWWLAHTVHPWPRADEDGPEANLREPGKTGARVRLIALALSLGVVVALAHRYWAIGALTTYGHDPSRVLADRVGLAPVLAASARIHAEYLVRMAFPLGLSPEYVDAVGTWSAPETLLCAGGLLLWLAYGLWAWTQPARDVRAARIAFVSLSFLALAVPTANLVPLPNMQADRYMYLPSFPIALGMVLLCDAFPFPRVTWTLLVALQGSYLQSASAAFRSDTRLWTIALRRAPEAVRAHAVMAELLTEREARPQAEVAARTHCLFAHRLDPMEPLTQLCAGRLAEHAHEGHAAVTHYQRAAALLRDRPQRAWIALARAHLADPTEPESERRRQAIALLERSTAAYPYDSTVWTTAGLLWHRLGEPERAETHYAVAAKLHPERDELWVYRIDLRLDLGDLERADALWAARPIDLAPEVERRVRKRVFAAHALR